MQLFSIYYRSYAILSKYNDATAKSCYNRIKHKLIESSLQESHDNNSTI
ncbi:hypothetical protein CLOSTMETH_03334 [[Clostridium] methylpentosum DSM 5476]|uniref:Uncharacterized protein n=1 Tax=[Clostridium] methylpentosum DSM 5476 TaxID=537013 RepID=C0EHD4_9FIRM|nr:hypothetical protein CLOSTMETH_03334 [[Clostridium] methylpentosum DSM 5476]